MWDSVRRSNIRVIEVIEKESGGREQWNKKIQEDIVKYPLTIVRDISL